MQKSKSKIQNLRKEYPKFIYKKYSYKISDKNLEIFFEFEIPPGIFFRPKITLKNVQKSQLKKIGDRALKNLIFHLGLMEIPSYWKATCSPIIEIRPGYLNKEQIKWWKDLIIKGMGQFFYENKIDFTKTNFLKIISASNINNVTRQDLVTLRDRWLVPVGGGKDSIVTLEKLKERRKKINAFVVNPSKAVKDVLKAAGVEKPVVLERKIDPLLLKFNKRGFLNGHTPFTALLSFLSVFCAVMFGYKNIAFSNEKSADEGNLRYFGKIINHQWSKSSEFEKKFKRYARKYLAPQVNYFSYLRKYTELEISRMFLKYPQYFSVFSSCNQNIKTGRKWCGNCPKCLFVYASLYPYLEKKTLLKIFGKPHTRTSSVRGRDIFENRKLLPTMEALIGRPPQRGESRPKDEGSHKPFECVGTYKESRKIFNLCLKKANPVIQFPARSAQSRQRRWKMIYGAKKSEKIPFLLRKLSQR